MPKDKKLTILLLVLVGISVFVAYIPAIQGGFLWDDDDYVQENRVLRSAAGLRAIWTDPMSVPQWYPLVHTTFWVEFQLWGLDPMGYHVTNVLLHIASTVLLFFVLRRLAVPGALLAAAVFALHPVMVESVAWITERKNVLSLVCYLGSLLCYLRFEDLEGERPARRRPWSLYAVSLLLFAAALLSKTVTCSLPAVVLLLVWWKRGRLPLGSVWPTLPFFAVALPMALLTAHLEQVRVGAVGAEWDLSLAERMLVAGRAIWFYAGKLVWPQELVFIYRRWQLDAGALWQHGFWVGVVVVLVSLFLLRRRIGRGPVVAACVFCGTLTPALGFFSVYPMRYSFVADHFQYHASIALIALLVGGMVRAFERKSRRKNWPGVGVGLALAVLAALGARTWWQCHKYQDLETLYLSILEDVPDSWFAHNNLAAVHVLEGRIDEALPLLRRAKEIHPDIAVNPGDETGPQIPPQAFALFQVGSILARSTRSIAEPLSEAEKERRLREAIGYFERALDVHSGYRSAHSNLASAKASLGDLAAAKGHFEEALELDPRDVTSLLGMVNLHLTLELRLLQAGRAGLAATHHEQAVSHGRRALEVGPDQPRVRAQLVKMHARMGDILLRRGLRGAGERHLREARAIERAGPRR